jgi:hypothetical protein
MTPDRIADRLETVIGIDGAPRRLISAIDNELIHFFGLPAIRAAEQAERVSASVARVLVKRATESRSIRHPGDNRHHLEYCSWLLSRIAVGRSRGGCRQTA